MPGRWLALALFSEVIEGAINSGSLPCKRNEADVGQVFGADGFFTGAGYEPEGLDAANGADGDDHTAADFELLNQGLGDVVGGGGDNDGVEGSLFFPAEVAVGVADCDVVVANFVEGDRCVIGQGGDDLDGVDLVDEAGKYRGLIAGSGANLEDSIFSGDTEGFGHEGDDVGLGNGLAIADG